MRSVDRVTRAYARIAEAERPEVWIALRPERDAQADARSVDARVDAGEDLALAGVTVAVKDNIDVAGMETTAACPSFAYRAEADAEVVARLRAAGAIVLGKTNMDQFATGLVGTRSPYGAVRDARRPEYASGGSSSGSAVAVALAHVDLALATDTAGSGRVPAAFQGIFGIKPTPGLAPTLGVVPACPSLDCVSVFARTLELAHTATAVMCGPHAHDPRSRAWPLDAPLGAPAAPVIAVPGTNHLGGLSPAARRSFAAATARAQETIGADVLEIDVTPFLEAGSLLYHGAFVAERYAAFGPFLEGHPDDADPHVLATIAAARSLAAHELVSDRQRLAELKHAAFRAMAGAHALLFPTTTSQPTIAGVLADPAAVNDRLGTYTTFCNLFEMCAVAVPAGEADGGHFGVTLYAPAFHDLALVDLAARLAGAAVARYGGPPTVPVFVLGAHMSGQPLNHELTDRGGRFVRETRTAPSYRLFALSTTPAKPALRRVDPDDHTGESILGELWALPVAGVGSLLACLPPPMTLGRVALIDGTEPLGFLCEQSALADAPEITASGGWRAYLALFEAAETTRMPAV